jgi:hypothetical protein
MEFYVFYKTHPFFYRLQSGGHIVAYRLGNEVAQSDVVRQIQFRRIENTLLVDDIRNLF